MKHKFELAYGNDFIPLEIPASVEPQVILPGKVQALENPLREVKAALTNPTGTPPLLEMLQNRKPGKVTVVVNDETRPTPYDMIFPPLLEIFKQAGITDDQFVFVIATGIHDPMSPELCSRTYGREMVSRFRFVNHESRDTSSLVDLGLTPSGYKCMLNRLAVETDFLITLGVVMPHYFAGFSGGRKSILPGLAGHETVSCNHARMVELLDHMPPIDENPVSLEMIEVARQVGVDFIINTVTNDKKELVSVQAGDLVQAWRRAVDVSASIYETPFAREADITVTCACGYPRDVNVYQAQKALDHAERITKRGGDIIWVGKCQDGFGENVFVKWLEKRLPPKELMREFRDGFELGGHKAYAIARTSVRNPITLISDMSAADTALMYASKADNLQEAFNAALARHGDRATVAVLPYGSLTLPVKK